MRTIKFAKEKAPRLKILSMKKGAYERATDELIRYLHPFVGKPNTKKVRRQIVKSLVKRKRR